MTSAIARNRLPSPWADFNGIMDQFFGSNDGQLAQAFSVPGSVWEEGQAYHIEMDVPGVQREDVDVNFEKGMLRVTAVRKELEGSRPGTRTFGKMTQTVTLPDSIDAESFNATLKDGVLHITVSKRPEAQPKRIRIE